MIPTYNRASLIEACVQSVLDQTFRDIEVIVVDDGSDDDTRERLEKFGAVVRCFRQGNMGCAEARNHGIRKARGELIAFNDSDDLWLSDKLEKQVRYLDEHPEIGLVCGNGLMTGAGGDEAEMVIPAERGARLARDGVTLREMLTRSCSRTPTIVARREVLSVLGGFDPTFRVCVDSEFMYRVLLKFKVAFMNEPLFRLGLHGGHVGGDLESRSRHDIRAIAKLTTEHPEVIETVGRTTIDRRLAYRFYRLGRACERKGKWSEALDAFRKSLSRRPGYLRPLSGLLRVIPRRIFAKAR